VIICPSPLTHSRHRPITASHSSRYDMLAIISSRYQYGPIFLLFFVAEVMSNYLTTDGLKKFLYFQRLLLRPEARGICHVCHMVNPALDLTPRQILQLTHQWATPDRLIRHWLFSTKNTANDVSCLSSPVISYVLNADSGR